MKTIVFTCTKGGVGRTTVSGNVAAALAQQGTKTAWVTTAEGDWAKRENLTVFGCPPDGIRQAVSDAQAATSDGVVIVDLPSCDSGSGWWTGEADVVLVTDSHPASLYAALETARSWKASRHPPVGFVLANARESVDEVVVRFKKSIAQYASLTLSHFATIPASAESATLVNVGRFCQGKQAAPYSSLAKRLAALDSGTGDKPDVLNRLRERRDTFKAA